MVSQGDNSEHEFEDWASAHGSLLPWSEDQTTASYQLTQLNYLRQYARASTRPHAAVPDEPSWLDTSSGWDQNPIILEVSDLSSSGTTLPGTGQAVPRAVAPLRAEPEKKRAVNRLPPARAAVAPQPALRPRMNLELDEEENPFARSHAEAKAWMFSILATAGLFCCVLFGRVLLRTGVDSEARPVQPVAAPAPQTSVAPTAPVEPVSQALEPSAEPAAESGTAALGSGRKQASRRPWHARSSRDSDEVDSESRARPERPERTEKHADDAPVAETKALPNPYDDTRTSETAAREAGPPIAGAPGVQSLLRINSRPWSQVFVDGQLVGNTPQFGVVVTAGRHTIRLVNPEFDMSKTFTVNVAPGESLTRIETLTE